jgi:hypothetical protein
MDDNLDIVQRFPDLSSAELARDYLASYGLRSEVIPARTSRSGNTSEYGLLVFDSKRARAEQLLADYTSSLARVAAQREARGPVEAACEGCGARSTFPGGQRGSVQRCPECGAYLDVPDPEGEGSAP